MRQFLCSSISIFVVYVLCREEERWAMTGMHPLCLLGGGVGGGNARHLEFLSVRICWARLYRTSKNTDDKSPCHQQRPSSADFRQVAVGFYL